MGAGEPDRGCGPRRWPTAAWSVPLRQADLYAATGNAQLLLQQAPTGSWTATAKVVHAGLTADGEALGLGLINSFNPNYFVKATVQYKNDTDPNTSGNQPGKWAERVLTVQRGGDHAAAGDGAVPELGCARDRRRLRLGPARL